MKQSQHTEVELLAELTALVQRMAAWHPTDRHRHALLAPLQQTVHALQVAIEERQAHYDDLSAELAGMRRLHALSTGLIPPRDPPEVLEAILDAALDFSHGEKSWHSGALRRPF